MISDEMKAKLIEAAAQARGWAYAPYSHYLVGAALLTASGKIYDGVNIENAAYPDSICAERVAIFKAVSEGEKEFSAMAVVTTNGGSPCGSCRQVIGEFAIDMPIYMADDQGKLVTELTGRDLLPHHFGPESLPTA